MKNRRLLFVLAFVIFVALGTVVCILVLNVTREEHVATIELPSGDRIIIKFYYPDLESALVRQSGGLKYDIYSGESHSSGELSIRDFLAASPQQAGQMKYDIYSGESHSSGQLGVAYDLALDVRLTHEIQGERRVKIEEGRRRESWIFEGDSSGKYKIIGSYEQPQEINGNRVSHLKY